MKTIVVLFAIALSAFAQQQQPSQARKPDCLVFFTLTVGSPDSVAVDNRQVGCQLWAVGYTSTGFTGLSLTVQGSTEQASPPTTWATFGTQVSPSTNPATATTAGFIQFTGYTGWVRVHLSGLTGTGTVKGILFGYLANSSSTGSGGGGGSGTVTSVTFTTPLVGTPNPITGVGTASCPTCVFDPTTLTADQVVVGNGTHAVKISNVTVSPTTSDIGTPGAISTGVGGAFSGELDLVGVTSGNTVILVADDDTPAATVNATRISGRQTVRADTITNGNCAQWNGTNGSAVLDQASAPCGSGGGGGSGPGITGYSGTGVTLAGTLFFPYVGGLIANATESSVDLEAPNAATISNFFVQLSVALGALNTTVFTWRKNGADTAVTCTITGASATTCNDTTHNFTVAQGDLLALKAVTTGTVISAPSVAFAAQFGITPTASPGVLGALFVPTQENTTSTTYVDLATLDTVTFNLSATTNIVVTYLAYEALNVGTNDVDNIVNIDGSDIAGSDTAASPPAAQNMVGSCQYATSLAAGTHTVKIRHRIGTSGGGTGQWLRRLLVVTAGP